MSNLWADSASVPSIFLFGSRLLLFATKYSYTTRVLNFPIKINLKPLFATGDTNEIGGKNYLRLTVKGAMAFARLTGKTDSPPGGPG
jgi:hypothetical protein